MAFENTNLKQKEVAMLIYQMEKLKIKLLELEFDGDILVEEEKFL